MSLLVLLLLLMLLLLLLLLLIGHKGLLETRKIEQNLSTGTQVAGGDVTNLRSGFVFPSRTAEPPLLRHVFPVASPPLTMTHRRRHQRSPFRPADDVAATWMICCRCC